MYSVLFSLWCRLPQMAANGTQWRIDDVRQGYSQPTVSKLSNRVENIAMSWYLRHPYSLDPVFNFFRVDDMTATTQSENSNEVAWPNVPMSSAIRFPQLSVPVEPRYMYQIALINIKLGIDDIHNAARKFFVILVKYQVIPFVMKRQCTDKVQSNLFTIRFTTRRQWFWGQV